MAYDYLGLVNDVNRRLNEVELTSSNFDSAIGEYAMVKDAILHWCHLKKIPSIIGYKMLLQEKTYIFTPFQICHQN